MSATLRYDIGRNLSECIYHAEPDLMTKFEGKEASRWGGVYKPRHECWTFAIKLPRQIKATMILLRVVNGAFTGSGLASFSAGKLLDKLLLSLGLPKPDRMRADEQRFINAIEAVPDDFALWLVYADWLEENGDEAMQQRATVIRAWNGPKAVPVKYGVLVAAMSEPSRTIALQQVARSKK